jgi:hypothetical protein
VPKNFKYHGRNTQCNKPPDPDGFDYLDTPELNYANETVGVKNITKDSATLMGLLFVAAGAEPAILRGFEYRPKGEDYYLITYEIGEFMSCEYEQEMEY